MEKQEIMEIAKERYSQFGIDIEKKTLMVYHTTNDNFYFSVVRVDKKSDDIAALLEEAFYDIVDSVNPNHLQDALWRIMGAVLSYGEEDIYDEYVPLDRGYVIPGLIDSVEFFGAED